MEKELKLDVDLSALRIILGNIFTAHAQNWLFVSRLQSWMFKSSNF